MNIWTGLAEKTEQISAFRDFELKARREVNVMQIERFQERLAAVRYAIYSFLIRF